MNTFLTSIQQIADWFLNLSIEDQLGVAAFFLIVLFCLFWLISKIAKAIAKKKEIAKLRFKLEDVTHEMFKKKGFVTYDLYIKNAGDKPVDVIRAGFILSDGTICPIYSEPHMLKIPDQTRLYPGQEAFYNDCDFFFTIQNKGINYKKITGFFADLKDCRRYQSKGDIHPLLNDKAIRGILTDKKGLHGF